MAVVTAGVVSAGMGVASAKMGADAASKGRKAQKQAGDRLAQVGFDPGDISNAFGGGVTFGADGGASFDLGSQQANADAFSSNFAGFAGNQAGLQNQFSQFGGRVQDRINQGPFQQGLQNSFFGGANQFAQRANQGFDGLRSEMLNTLRQQAAPFEQRAFSGLQDSQFATGQLGSSGGALQTEAFARGLGQVDLDRQLQSIGQAQQLQSQQAGLASQFAQSGAGVAATGESLLQSSLNQFGQAQGMLGQNQAFMGQAQSGQGQLQDQMLALGQFGANLGATESDVNLRAAGGAAAAANNFANTAGSGDVFAGALGSAANNVAGGSLNGVFDGLGSLFGGGGAPAGTAGPDLFSNTAQFVGGGNNAP